MSADHNYLDLSDPCPKCGKADAVWIQIAAAASLNGDAEHGRFCMRNYKIGDKLPWWPADSPWFDAWTNHPDISPLDSHHHREISAPGQCKNCGADVECEIIYRDLVIVRIEHLRVAPGLSEVEARQVELVKVLRDTIATTTPSNLHETITCIDIVLDNRIVVEETTRDALHRVNVDFEKLYASALCAVEQGQTFWTGQLIQDLEHLKQQALEALS